MLGFAGLVVAAASCTSDTSAGQPTSTTAAPAAGSAAAGERPPANPWLAHSAYPMSHANSAQQDSTDVPGPTGPTQRLTPEQIELAPIGPAHFGAAISSPYADGRRVVWTNGGDRIVKLDEASFTVLAERPLPGKAQWSTEEMDAATARLDAAVGTDEAPGVAVQLAARMLQGLAGVYSVLDRDGNFYVGDAQGLVVYGDADPRDPASPIVERRRWAMPGEVQGGLVGMNMTYDGHLVLATDVGFVVVVDRDLTSASWVQLAHSEDAAAYSAAATARGQTGYGWVRNSFAVDPEGGIYIASAEHLHKVRWTGDHLSVDPADGAWVEPYRDDRGLGTGSTPVLMGFGPDEDHLVVMTDGDTLMNVTAYWRDDVPAGWTAPPGSPSPRVAGFTPVTMGDPGRRAIQTEQAVIVAGYGMVVVDNEPASIPPGFPAGRASTLLTGYLGNDARFTPHGMQKFVWDPTSRTVQEAWVNREVSSPNSLPFVSTGSGLVYTIGVRDGEWSFEGVDWADGSSRFHWVLGGARFDSLYSGVILDDRGRPMYGGLFGKIRLPGP